MASFDSGKPHFALSKDISVGGIRLLSSITPYHFDKAEPVKSPPPPPLNSEPASEGTSADVERANEQPVDFDQRGGGSGEGHNVKHISTTEAEIERARSDLQNRHINIKSIRNAQSLLRGQGGKKQSGKSKGKSSSSKGKSKKASAKKKSQGKKKAKSKPAKKKTSKKKKKSAQKKKKPSKKQASKKRK